MSTFARAFPKSKPLPLLAAFTIVTGAVGMALSYAYLTSADQLDVIAGAAGFVAGAILIASGLISAAVLSWGRDQVAEAAPGIPEPIADRWLAHFRRNQDHRPEPDWKAPLTLPAETIAPLVHSLEQFQLGDGGGPAGLIAWNAEQFRSSSADTRTLVDLWFAEEREHARLLGQAVARFGGTCIHSHWSFRAFCLTRRWFGVNFELAVLLLTEIVSTVYYRLLRRHGDDQALKAMCKLILRDEAGHIAFHRDRLAEAGRLGQARYGWLWEMCFRALGLVAASVLFVNHADGLKAVGATTAEFYREVWRELSRFIRRLRLETRDSTVPRL